jgi:hypothetical protein
MHTHAAALALAHAIGTLLHLVVAWLTIVCVRVPCAERGRLLLGGVCGSGGATAARRCGHAPHNDIVFTQWRGAFHAVSQRIRHPLPRRRCRAARLPPRFAG